MTMAPTAQSQTMRSNRIEAPRGSLPVQIRLFSLLDEEQLKHHSEAQDEGTRTQKRYEQFCIQNYGISESRQESYPSECAVDLSRIGQNPASPSNYPLLNVNSAYGREVFAMLVMFYN
jgi:hypothetical protein